MIIFYPSPKLTDQEKLSLVTYFLPIYQDQSIENNTKRILTHILNRCDRNKSSTHPTTHAFTRAEHVALKVCSIVLK